MTENSKKKPFMKTLLFGLGTIVLYVVFIFNAQKVTEIISQGRWSFVLVIIIAFIFSFFHGNFTSYFWDLVGIHGKTEGEK